MQKFIKRFQEWFAVKPKLDESNSKPPFTKEGQMWWCSVGENIGTEISGKSSNFTRPVVILKKLSRYQFMVIPCSTKIKEGSWYVQFNHRDKKQVANLSQARTVDFRRLTTLMGDLDNKDFMDIKNGFLNLYR
jgi:mRNA interferase MazF